MADNRVILPVSLVDRTTPTQKLSISAGGAALVDTELPAAGALGDNTANPTLPSVGSFPHVFDGTDWDRLRAVLNGLDSAGQGILATGVVGQLDDTATGAVTENQFAPVRISTRRALLVEGVASGTNLNVNLAASAATVTVDSELPTALALADGASNPTAPAVGAFLMGWNGSTWDRVDVANSGRLQVDVITGGGTDSPTTPVLDTASSSGTAAGSSANLDTADLGGLTRKLWQCIVTASVAFKAVIQQVENGSSVKTLVTLFGRAGEAAAYKPSHREFTSRAFAANAGFDGFRAVVSNLDTSEAADLYAAFEYAAN